MQVGSNGCELGDGDKAPSQDDRQTAMGKIRSVQMNVIPVRTSQECSLRNISWTIQPGRFHNQPDGCNAHSLFNFPSHPTRQGDQSVLTDNPSNRTSSNIHSREQFGSHPSGRFSNSIWTSLAALQPFALAFGVLKGLRGKGSI